MTTNPDTGVEPRYHVTRNDGRSVFGAKHYGCQYFVLDVTHADDHTRAALKAYADSCRDQFPELAADLDYAASTDAQVDRAMQRVHGIDPPARWPNTHWSTR